MKILFYVCVVFIVLVISVFVDVLFLSYEVFEVLILYFGLEDCLSLMNVDNGFCCVIFYSEEVYIFVFFYDVDSLLIGFKSFLVESFGILLK